RLVKGYDPRIDQLPNYPSALTQHLAKLEYATPFEIMTLQDAVDYAIFLTRATIGMQRFSYGIASAPGFTQDVGGAIDIAIVEPNKDFNFLQEKKLHGE